MAQIQGGGVVPYQGGFAEALTQAGSAFKDAVELLQRREQLGILEKQIQAEEQSSQREVASKLFLADVESYTGGLRQLAVEQPDRLDFWWTQLGAPNPKGLTAEAAKGTIPMDRLAEFLASKEVGAVGRGETGVKRTELFRQLSTEAPSGEPTTKTVTETVQPEVKPFTPQAQVEAVPPEPSLQFTAAEQDTPVVAQYLKWKQQWGHDAALNRVGAVLEGAPRMMGEPRENWDIPGLGARPGSPEAKQLWNSFKAKVEKQTGGDSYEARTYKVDVGSISADLMWTTEAWEWEAAPGKIKISGLLDNIQENTGYKGSSAEFLQQMWKLNDLNQTKFKSAKEFSDNIQSLSQDGLRVPGPPPETISREVLDYSSPGKQRMLQHRYEKVELAIEGTREGMEAATKFVDAGDPYSWADDPEARHRVINQLLGGIDVVMATAIPPEHITKLELEKSLSMIDVKLAELEISAREAVARTGLSEKETEARILYYKVQGAILGLQVRSAAAAQAGDSLAKNVAHAFNTIKEARKLYGKDLDDPIKLAGIIEKDRKGANTLEAAYRLVLSMFAKENKGKVTSRDVAVSSIHGGAPMFAFLSRFITIPGYEPGEGGATPTWGELAEFSEDVQTQMDAGLAEELRRVMAPTLIGE